MSCSLSDFFIKQDGELMSRELYSSFQSSVEEFNRCFFDICEYEYDVVFGNEPRNRFLYRLLKEFYRNDYFIRYSFINKVLVKSSAISFEEFPVANSRADLVSINGKSIAYEIKSEFDNYERLDKQIEDYSKVFEYVYVICPKKKVEAIKSHLPEYCGLFVYNGNKKICFNLYKKAVLSPNLSSLHMLDCFRKKELISSFTCNDTAKILSNFEFDKINKSFKSILKKRFSKKWASLKEEAESLK